MFLSWSCLQVLRRARQGSSNNPERGELRQTPGEGGEDSCSHSEHLDWMLGVVTRQVPGSSTDHF